MTQLFHGVFDGPRPETANLIAMFTHYPHALAYLEHIEKRYRIANPTIDIKFSIRGVRVEAKRLMPLDSPDMRCIS